MIRPDTIVYLACSIAMLYRDQKGRKRLRDIFDDEFGQISDWTEPVFILPYLVRMAEKIDEILLDKLYLQEPLVLQPVWKTIGKSPKLADNCLDVFVWSNFALTRLFIDTTKKSGRRKIDRQARSVVWLFKMLYDFGKSGQINHSEIIDKLSFNVKNDKAFAVSGRITHSYMKSEYLKNPRIHKSEIKKIILGDGQNLLSPERRFDAIVYNSSDLFD